MAYAINPSLLNLAEHTLRHEKAAFVPTGATDPAAAAGGDPAAAAGGGMAPPMPGAGGMGAPPMPMDPMAAGGGMPGGMPGDMQSMITQAVQQAMQQSGGGGGGGKGTGSSKVDPALIYQELGRCRKLLTHLYSVQGIPLPPDILNDAMVAQSVSGQTPTSDPISGDAGAVGGPVPPPSAPAVGESPAISPLGPMAPADPAAAGGIPKQGQMHASQRFEHISNDIDAMAQLARRLQQQQS